MWFSHRIKVTEVPSWQLYWNLSFVIIIFVSCFSICLFYFLPSPLFLSPHLLPYIVVMMLQQGEWQREMDKREEEEEEEMEKKWESKGSKEVAGGRRKKGENLFSLVTSFSICISRMLWKIIWFSYRWNNTLMVLVNQNSRVVWLQFLFYNTKLKDLFTFENKLLYLHP